MSSQDWRKNWVCEKCNIAISLFRGEAGGGYAESVIIACAALSALSAEIWIDRQIDRVRFIEMLTKYGPQSDDCKTISIPLLINYLQSKSRTFEAISIQNAFSIPSSARVLTGQDVDKSESEVLSVCPQLLPKEVRNFSYASILYAEIRSSYAHEYRPGKQADSWPMTMASNQKVSYINRITDNKGMIRLIHIHFEWIVQLANELANEVDQIANILPMSKPQIWWAEGG